MSEQATIRKSGTSGVDSAAPLLRISALGKTYEAANGPVEALNGIDLVVEKGQFVCLLGASGCGKSTLLRIVAGFEAASRGAVQVFGYEVTGPGPIAVWSFRTTRFSPG